MAIPEDPSVMTVVRAGLKQAGQNPPSANDEAEGLGTFLKQTKSDLRRVAGTHTLLDTEGMTVTTIGKQRYDQPRNANEIQYVSIFDGPDSFRGTAQAGTPNTITLASDLSEEASRLRGLWIILTSGTGGAPDTESHTHQFRQIIAYNDSTKIAIIDEDWSTPPSSDTEYLIADERREIRLIDDETELRRYSGFKTVDRPTRAAQFGERIEFNTVPDKVYGIYWKYYADIDRLDEAGSLFTKLLREWYSVFVQGIKTYAMARYDEARHPQALTVYQVQLDTLESESLTGGQITPKDV